ncbi:MULTISPECIES: hypothetical protein [unclassified Roseateles]|uniref:hypothetical protein n=1 Tax=unclassified Roseateles TaxID=2626991 RepID=UPI0006F41CE0|nr:MULTISPECIES: hypothetical protein [unclassified Roseateles]KQW44926.1 hypothetical protein ASC81_15295 [Pelomonas sp. Root405]KRA70286.1 hypothetical protein ASD88_19455 [Pelomonas sp. Root662]
MPLLLGTLAIAACLSLTGPEYLKPSSEGNEAKESSAASPSRAVLVPLIPLERQGTLARPVNDAIHGAARNRVAANVLLRSGYLSSFAIETDPSTGLRAFTAVPDPNIEGCAFAGGGERETQQLARLAMAVVAVEKFNRSWPQRRMEWWLAKTALALSGRIPDLSFGPAQIRPSTIAGMAAQAKALPAVHAYGQLPPAKLLGQLMDECAALGMAANLLMQWREEKGNLSAAIQAYGGQRRETYAVVDYVPVVFAIAGLFVDQRPPLEESTDTELGESSSQ